MESSLIEWILKQEDTIYAIHGVTTNTSKLNSFCLGRCHVVATLLPFHWPQSHKDADKFKLKGRA